MKINDTHDAFGPDGPEVEPSLLLKYLIEKSEQLSQLNYRGFPLPFRVFGVTVLNPFPELQEAFLQIVTPSEEPLRERADKCKRLFVEVQDRPQDTNSYHSSGESDEDSPVSRGVSTRFCWSARRLGEEMVERKDFQFMPVWMCMTYIGFRKDTETFRKFQDVCLRYPDPAERIEQVIPILWEAVRSGMRRRQASSEQAN